MIKVEKVYKQFKGIVLFENLSVNFPSNKKIWIKGVNGSGKSVFLKMLVGYSRPDSGKITIDGCLLGTDRDFIPNAGVFINAPEFMKNMTGWENLKYLADIRKQATDEEIMELIEYLGLKEHIHKKYKTYSLGMKQKLRIVQALMEKPQYLILDEPFDGLDKTSQKLVTKLLDEYMNKDRTLIFTSHNEAYEKFADIIYEIDNYTLTKVK